MKNAINHHPARSAMRDIWPAGRIKLGAGACRLMAILSMLWAYGLMGVMACAADAPAAFTSRDYVIHRYQESDTLAGLAGRYLKDASKTWVIADANERPAFSPGDWVVIPLNPENVWGLTPEGYQTVPILTYHRFSELCRSDICISESDFGKQMELLHRKGCRTIDFQAFSDYFDYKKPIPKNAVIITVDDGFRSAYDIAYPILKKYGFHASLFVYTNFVSASPSAITWDQLREMKSDGFEVGSHTLSHCNLLVQNETETPVDYHRRIMGELRQSKSIIDKKLAQDTQVLAYPYGNYNPEIIMMSKQAGYRFAVTVKGGSTSFLNAPFVLKRNSVFKPDLDSFQALLKTHESLDQP